MADLAALLHDMGLGCWYDSSHVQFCDETTHTEAAARLEAAGVTAPRSDDAAPLRAIVDEQAEDEGLWFIAATAPEAYLQQELRRLHAAIEAAGVRVGWPHRDHDPFATWQGECGHLWRYRGEPNECQTCNEMAGLADAYQLVAAALTEPKP